MCSSRGKAAGAIMSRRRAITLRPPAHSDPMNNSCKTRRPTTCGPSVALYTNTQPSVALQWAEWAAWGAESWWRAPERTGPEFQAENRISDTRVFYCNASNSGSVRESCARRRNFFLQICRFPAVNCTKMCLALPVPAGGAIAPPDFLAVTNGKGRMEGEGKGWE